MFCKKIGATFEQRKELKVRKFSGVCLRSTPATFTNMFAFLYCMHIIVDVHITHFCGWIVFFQKHALYTVKINFVFRNKPHTVINL